jgi:hypothetical protein
MAIRAFAIRTRSITARRRPNRVMEGERSMETVLGISVGIGALRVGASATVCRDLRK